MYLKKALVTAVSAAVFLCMMFSSCASSDSYGDASSNQQYIARMISTGDFTSAAEFAGREHRNKNEQIRQNLDLAMLQHYAGDYKNSSKLLNKTDMLMEKAYTKSVTKAMAAMIGNENAAQYDGTVYEYIYINAFNALNYYNQNDIENALVEMRRFQNKQKEYLLKYGQAAAVRTAVDTGSDVSTNNAARFFGINMTSLQKKSPRPADSTDIFRDSALAEYVSVFLNILNGHEDEAAVSSRALARINPSFPVSGEFGIPPDGSRIDVVAFSGLIGRRKEQVMYFPRDYIYGGVLGLATGISFTPDGQWLRMVMRLNDANGRPVTVDVPAFRFKFAFPAFDARTSSGPADSVKIVFDDGTEQKLSLLENFDVAAESDIAVKAERAYARSVSRSLVKKMSAVTAGTAALAMLGGREGGNIGQQILYQLSYAALVASIEAVDLTETADVRQCSYLPKRADAGGVSVSPGTYSFTVQYYKGTQMTGQQRFENVRAEPGKAVLVESLCIR